MRLERKILMLFLLVLTFSVALSMYGLGCGISRST